MRIADSAPNTAAAPQIPEPTEVRRAMSLSIFSNLPINIPPQMVTTTMMASMIMAGNPTAVMS